MDELLQGWRTHEAINHMLLEAVSDAALDAIPLLKDGKPGRGRNIARVYGHMIDCRMSGMRKPEFAVAAGFKGFEKGAVPTRDEIIDGLTVSSRAVEARAAAAANGDLVHKRGPGVYLAYLICHESHHRGQIMLALKQNGFTLSDVHKWGIWERWFKG